MALDFVAYLSVVLVRDIEKSLERCPIKKLSFDLSERGVVLICDSESAANRLPPQSNLIIFRGSGHLKMIILDHYSQTKNLLKFPMLSNFNRRLKSDKLIRQNDKLVRDYLYLHVGSFDIFQRGF